MKDVRELVESVGSPLVTPFDVRDDGDIERVFAEVAETFDGGLDLLVHSVALAAGRRSTPRCATSPGISVRGACV